MKSNHFSPSDRDLLKRIQDRIRWDIRVSNSDISFKVEEGKVSLFGHFDKYYRHEAALKIISTTTGVEEVDDQTQVLENYYRTDEVIETLITKEIRTLAFLPDEWITADVQDGVVKLEGYVYRPRFKAFAAHAAWELSGVKDCFNRIEVKETPGKAKKNRPAHVLPNVNLNTLSSINWDYS